MPENQGKLHTNTFYTVTRIVDAQTLILNDDKELKVRLVGIDVPERYPTKKLYRQIKAYGMTRDEIMQLGEGSVAFLEDLCLGQQVTMGFDPTWNDSWGRDAQKRIMVHLMVYREDDLSDTFLQTIARRDDVPPEIMDDGRIKLWINAEMIKEGYARADRNRPGKFADLFDRLEKRARTEKRGHWQNAKWLRSKNAALPK
jgi:endonuclease YncB( thermonuclease family)